MAEPEFIEFPKMARFSREIIVTEKIDGTNAQVWISDDGTETHHRRAHGPLGRARSPPEREMYAWADVADLIPVEAQDE